MFALFYSPVDVGVFLNLECSMNTNVRVTLSDGLKGNKQLCVFNIGSTHHHLPTIPVEVVELITILRSKPAIVFTHWVAPL